MKKLISESTAYFWNESFGSIYPTLHKLESEGFVFRQEGDGNRKLIKYSISKKGEKALKEWLAKPVENQKPRNELLLKLFFGSNCSQEQAREHIKIKLFSVEQQLKELQHIAEDLETHYSENPSLPYWMMTVNHGIFQMKATINWCKQTLATLETL